MRRKISKFKKRVLRLLPWLFGIIIVLWIAGLFLVRPLARSAISNFCNDAAVYIESGRLKGLSGIRLKGVVIASDTEALVDAPIFRFDEIDLAFDPWKLVRGKFKIRSIRMSDFLFNAAYETKGQWNFSSLIRRDFQPTAPSEKLPLVKIRNGAMRISRLEDGQPKAITTISLNGQIAVKTGKREYSFSLKTDGRFGFADSVLSGRLKIAQPGQKHQFFAEGQIHMSKTKVFDNAWDLDNVHLEYEFDQHQVQLKRCEFAMGSSNVDVQGTITKDEEDLRQLNLQVDIRQFKISDHHEKNVIVYSQPLLEMLGPGLRGFLQRYHPFGTGDLQLSVEGTLEDLSKTRIEGSVTCRDISILYEKFPYQLTHLQGVVDFTGRDVFLRQLTAEHDDVELTINGSLQDLGPNVQTDLRITSPNMEFNEDLYQALKQARKKVWYSFTPTGRAGIDYHLQRFADGGTDRTLILNLKNANCIYEHFPYPLQNLTGTVTVKQDNVELKDIVSHYEDERRIMLNGYVSELTAAQPEFWIDIDAEQIPVDDLLVNAMPPAQRDFFGQLQLEATANVNVDILRDQTTEERLDYHAKISADGKRLLYEPFPLPMEDVHLSADVTQEMIQLDNFDAAAAGGRIQMSGTLTPKGIEPDAPGVCLDIGLEDFDFNETFWNAAGENAERILGKLRIGGPMDISGHLAMNLSGPVCDQTNLLIRCSDNPVSWDNSLLGNAFGQFHLTDDSIRFEDFQFKQVPLEELPEDLLEGRYKAIYTGLQPQGMIEVRINTGTIDLGKHPKGFNFEGGICLEDVAVGPDHVIHNLDGEISGDLKYDPATNAWQSLTFCDIDNFNYRRWQVKDFQGNFIYDPNTRQFKGKNIEAELYGGSMNGDAEVDFSLEDTIDYQLKFTADNVDVPRLIAAGQQFQTDRVLQGKASGTLSLGGDLRVPAESQGQATVHVVNIQLGKQSILGKILTAMQFKQPDEYVFSEFEAQADVYGPQLDVKDIRMVGKPLVFRGTGTLDLAQRQIAMDWVAFDRLMGSEDTILDKLARGIGSAVWKVEVRGDINEPQIKTVFLSVLRQPLDIFQKQQP